MLKTTEFKTGYEIMGRANMSTAYLIKNLKEKTNPFEFMLLEMSAKHHASIDTLYKKVAHLVRSVEVIRDFLQSLLKEGCGKCNM